METKLTAIILQARLDSKRLPKKALLPLNGKPIIFRVMEALNHVPADLRILACPEDSLAAFSPIAEEAGYKIHTGPKEDVLERFCQVIRRFGIDHVIRATGDNPFVFADAAAAINDEAVALNADYAGFLELPLGAGVESVSAVALQRAAMEGATAYDREHVCPFLYNNADLYKLHRPAAPEKWRFPKIRLTVDTKKDYKMAQLLYSKLSNLGAEQYQGSVIINKYQTLFGKKIGKSC